MFLNVWNNRQDQMLQEMVLSQPLSSFLGLGPGGAFNTSNPASRTTTGGHFKHSCPPTSTPTALVLSIKVKIYDGLCFFHPLKTYSIPRIELRVGRVIHTARSHSTYHTCRVPYSQWKERKVKPVQGEGVKADVSHTVWCDVPHHPLHQLNTHLSNVDNSNDI